MHELTFASVEEEDALDTGGNITLYPFTIHVFHTKKTYYAIKKSERDLWMGAIYTALGYSNQLKNYDVKVFIGFSKL